MIVDYRTTRMPVDVPVNEIAEEAQQAAFKVIADRMAESGYPVTGDIWPHEATALDDLFQTFVRMLAVNNAEINALQEDDEEDDQ